jgi:tRNA modification GTPase
MDTIVALATARGRAGVAVVRVSGPSAWDVCLSLTGSVPPARQAVLRPLRGADGGLIDTALVVTFAPPASFTGEEVVEFQTHGSPPVIAALIRECLALPGVRAAEAGEFTRRAFHAGKLDLTQVEALSDLLDAETESQRRQAIRVLDGALSRVVEAWRETMLDALALCEASVDFADEDVPQDLAASARMLAGGLRDQIMAQISGRNAAERLRDGFEVAIIGAVNTGKSTLLNTLAGREAAITSARAGTTRDVIEVRMEIGTLPVTLIDTAGLRETTDEIESIGIARGQSRARAADLRIYLCNGPDDHPDTQADTDIVVLSKADLWGMPGLSSVTGQGVSELLTQIEERLGGRAAVSTVFSRARHFDKLQRAVDHLNVAELELGASVQWEVAAEELRLALRALDGLVGRVDVEDVLGRIFSSFCIGK